MQPELERIEHVERVAALGDRAFLALGRILDALQRDQRIDRRNRAQGAGGGRIARRLLLAEREGAAGGAARAGRRVGKRGSVRSVNAHGEQSQPTRLSVPEYP